MYTFLVYLTVLHFMILCNVCVCGGGEGWVCVWGGVCVCVCVSVVVLFCFVLFCIMNTKYDQKRITLNQRAHNC